MGRAEVKTFQHHAGKVTEFLRERLEKKVSVKLVCHQDADGIASAAILAKCFQYYDVPFVLHFSRPKRSEEIAELADEDHELYIFLDQGSGQVEAIHKSLLAKRRDVLIIDHHPGSFPEHPNLAFLNPHASGLNGAKDVSASGAVYLLAENLDLRFRAALGLAIVGALGDRQEFFTGFTGVNDLLMKRAVDLGIVELGEGLRLIGRTFRPVVECLRSSTRPYLVGLSGSPTACKSLLDGLDIRPTLSIAHLGLEEERALADAICTRVGPVATKEEFRHTFWGTLYADSSRKFVGSLEFRECAAILDACGTLGKPQVGFAALMGDRGALQEAMGLLANYQEEMLRIVGWFMRNLGGVEERDHFRCLDCGKEVKPSFVGEAVSLLMESGLIEMPKPFIAISLTPSGSLKVSARGTPALAMRGVDVGRALSFAALRVGGSGGGHDVAAAARFSSDRKEDFLVELDRALGEAP
jgi:RecJ-like exonuclease